MTGGGIAKHGECLRIFMRRNEPSVARLFEGEARVSKPQVNESIKKQTGGSFAIPPPVTEFTVFYIFTIDNLGLLRYNKLVMYAHQIYYIIKYIIKTFKRRIHPC